MNDQAGGKTISRGDTSLGLDKRRLVLLGAIVALGSLAIQIIVPALPLLSTDIGTSASGGQLIISVYLAVLALGQLVWASVADRHGRRPVLMGGVTVFLTGSAICMVSTGLEMILIGRVVQALGASSSLVAARAMATDRAPIGRAAAPLAIMTSVTLISPAVAPTLGGAIASAAGWRALFGVLAALTIVSGVLAFATLAETHTERQSSSDRRSALATYMDVARTAGFLPRAACNALVSSAFYLFLGVSPFVLASAGATPFVSGIFYSIIASAIIVGTLTVPVVMRRRPRMLKPLGSASLAVGGMLALWMGLATGHVVVLLLAMCFIAFGSGLTGPTLLGEAIDAQRSRASATTSLFGTLQMGGAALVSTVIVRFVPSRAIELGLIGVLVLLALVARHMGAPAETE